MDKLLYLLPALVCPVAMGLMMWFMARKPSREQTAPQQPPVMADPRDAELARLRAELATNRVESRHPAG